MKAINKIGLSIGRLFVLDKLKSSTGLTMWRCRCQCGQETTVLNSNLRLGHTESCGCFHKEQTRKGRRIHGEAQTVRGSCTPEYRAWSHAKSRCYDKNDKRYTDYGGRGIVMCEKWRESYLAFLADMGHRPLGRFSLDRIDVNGNYEPSNCRWATDQQQARNKRKYKTLFMLN